MPKYTVSNLNKFLLLKLPSAYFSGVRVKSIAENEAIATVKHRWINQNPFRSMYWATQGMASELATGILVMKKIRESGRKISMLVRAQQGEFPKKATGRINFNCAEGHLIDAAIQRSIDTGEGQTVTLTSKGVDEQGDVVSEFKYTWGIKVKA